MFKKTIAVRLIILFFSVAVMFEPVFAAQGADVIIGVTTGKGRVKGHDLQHAEKEAVADALSIAVQNAFADLVSREIFAANLDFFYNQVLAHTSDYIVTYRVLGGIENKGNYLVAVESKMDVTLLEKTLTDARILNDGNDKPVILFFIAEKTPSDLLPRYWWGKNPIPYESLAEKIIVSQLLQDRFIVTGNEADRPDPSFYNITFNSIYDIDAAMNLGREMKADMIVFGKAVSSEATNRMGEDKTFDAQINLDAYNLETGEKALVSQVEAAAVSDMDQEGHAKAIVKAAELSSLDLSKRITEYWAQNLRKEHTFEVKLEGDNFLPRFLALKQQFKQMPGIENIHPKEMGSNSALIEVFYKGKSSQFAAAVMLKTFDLFGLEISEVSDRLVTIKFIEKQLPFAVDADDSQSTIDPNATMENAPQ